MINQASRQRAIRVALVIWLSAGCSPPAPAALSATPTVTLVTSTETETATPLPPTATLVPIRPLEIASTRDLGVIKKPPRVSTRDGGASALIDGKVFWWFGDTIFPGTKSVDGVNGVSNTAAWADLAKPFDVNEPLDVTGAPYQFVPLTPEEQASNDTISLWPGSVIPDGRGGGIVYYLKLGSGFNFHGVGLARFNADSQQAVRDPGLIFTVPEPNFDNATLVGNYVYLYGRLNDATEDHPVAVARVPFVDLANRNAYRFWNGSRWVVDVVEAAPVLYSIPGEMTVSFNPYLNQYLAVHSEVLSNRVLMHVSKNPEGPWSSPTEAFVGMTPSEGNIYAGREHPELMQNGGRTVIVSYYQRTGNEYEGELRLVEVNFK